MPFSFRLFSINVIWVGMALLLFTMPILKYGSLHASFYDLGQYSVIAFNMAQDLGWTWIFRSHATPIVYVYAQFYAFWPDPRLLLLIQSTALVGGANLFALLWRLKGLPFPWACSALYLFSTSVWFNALFDFHPEHILFVLFPLFFLVLESSFSVRKKQILVLLIVLAFCGVKETFALSALMMGPYVVWRCGWWRIGLLIVFLAAGYFLLAAQILIPYFTESQGAVSLWKSAFGYLGNSPGEMIAFIISNPFALAAEIAANSGKWRFVILLFLPFAFLPFLSPRELMLALPPLGIALLSQEAKHFTYGHQYTAGIMPPLFAAFIYALASPKFETALALWRSRAVFGAVTLTILMHVVLSPSPLSRLFWNGKIWDYGKSAYIQTARARLIIAAIERFVPADKSVVVTSQNTLTTARLVNRTHSFAFPLGAFEFLNWQPRETLSIGGLLESGRSANMALPAIEAEFVVIDQKRPISLHDKTCDWQYGSCRNQEIVDSVLLLEQKLHRDFDVLHADDGFFIYKRKPIS